MSPPTLPDGIPWPRITLVTPTYNQGAFIEETIRSVLLQGYPNLEYFIIDGGSTDDTVEIIKKYEDRLCGWVSKPDGGPVDAIKKGLSRATGEWFNWLNSDDYLLPGALRALAEVIRSVPDAKWVSGVRLNVNREGGAGSVTWSWRTSPSLIPLGIGPLPQDATFIRLSFLRENGLELNEELGCIFDTVLHHRMLRLTKPILTTAVFSAMRWHPDQITSALAAKRHEESKKFLAPLSADLPMMSRIALRLLNTRMHAFISAVLSLAGYFGWTAASREWKACVFDHWQQKIRVLEARRLLFANFF
jgi:glycosyltransferase involved in cell wall biosynthesis